MTSPGSGGGGQPLYDRLWGSGFLPTKYQGVKFRSVGDPVLYLSNPAGFTRQDRRTYLDALGQLNQLALDDYGDPEISTRISQYEMAFRMQSSVPELTDLSMEPAETFERYGADARKPGTYAANCLLARFGWRSAAYASSNSSTAIGTIMATCRKICRSAVKKRIRPQPPS